MPLITMVASVEEIKIGAFVKVHFSPQSTFSHTLLHLSLTQPCNTCKLQFVWEALLHSYNK